MITYKTISSLKEGQLYIMITHIGGIKAENKVIFLSNDYTGLNRKIGYFCYADRKGLIPTSEKFVNSYKAGKMLNNTFALWEHEITKGDTEILRIEC